MMAAIGEDGISDVVKAIEKIKQERDTAWLELSSIRSVIKADEEESTLDEVKRIVCLADKHQVPTPSGYVVQRPAKVLVRITKIDRAKERALCFARREGKRAKVFALIPVGESVPGAEWSEA